MTCSSTGHPAPVVTLEIPDHVPVANSSTVSVTNPNGTVTVTAAATLAAFGLRGNGLRVRCVASLSSEVAKAVSTTLPAADLAFSHGEERFAISPLWFEVTPEVTIPLATVSPPPRRCRSET